MVHNCTRVSTYRLYTVYRRFFSRKRKTTTSPSFLPRQLTLKKVGRVKRYVCYEATGKRVFLLFSFFFSVTFEVLGISRDETKKVSSTDSTRAWTTTTGIYALDEHW